MSNAGLSGKRLFLFPVAWPLTQSVSKGEAPGGVLGAVHHGSGLLCALISWSSRMCDGPTPLWKSTLRPAIALFMEKYNLPATEPIHIAHGSAIQPDPFIG